MPQSLLLISRSAPWSGLTARETLDIALAGGAFELPISMLFLDDAVLQLRPAQQPSALQQKDLQANLSALPMFGIEQLYACGHSLQQRGLTPEQLSLEVQVLNQAQLRELIDQHDQVITFS